MGDVGNIPKHWEIKKLGEVCGIVYGKGLPVKALKPSGYPVFGANGIIGFNDKYLFEEPQVLISCRGAASGKINLSPPKCYVTNNSLVLDIRKKNELDKNYLFYALSIAKKTKLVTGTAQPQVTINNAVELDISFPPLPEQQAIVSKIEELLSDLENGKQQLQTAQQQLKVYRQSLLKWAFEGKLTNKNVKAGELPKGWKLVKFGEVHEIKSNLVNALEHLNSPHIAPDNISKGTGKLLSYKTIREDKVFSPKHKFFKGQIVYSKIRPNLAKVIIAPIDGLCSADMYPIDSKYNNQFTFYYMLTNSFIRIASNTESRTILPKINQKGLNEIPFPLPPIAEQQLIVAELESKLTVCDKIEETISQSLQQAETLRQSILKKAFEGKLVQTKVFTGKKKELV